MTRKFEKPSYADACFSDSSMKWIYTWVCDATLKDLHLSVASCYYHYHQAEKTKNGKLIIFYILLGLRNFLDSLLMDGDTLQCGQFILKNFKKAL